MPFLENYPPEVRAAAYALEALRNFQQRHESRPRYRKARTKRGKAQTVPTYAERARAARQAIRQVRALLGNRRIRIMEMCDIWDAHKAIRRRT